MEYTMTVAGSISSVMDMLGSVCEELTVDGSSRIGTHEQSSSE
jgi:hypothetical protein